MYPIKLDFVSVRSFLREMAPVLRALKELRKEDKNRRELSDAVVTQAQHLLRTNWNSLYHIRKNMRLFHIAWSEFLGNPREVIERKAHEKLNDYSDERIISELKERMMNDNKKIDIPSGDSSVSIPSVGSNDVDAKAQA